MTCGPVCRGRGWWVPLGLGWSTKKREATWPHAAPDSFCGPYPDEGSCRSVVLVRLFAQNLRISSLGLVLGKLREVHQYDTCSQTLDRNSPCKPWQPPPSGQRPNECGGFLLQLGRAFLRGLHFAYSSRPCSISRTTSSLLRRPARNKDHQLHLHRQHQICRTATTPEMAPTVRWYYPSIIVQAR